MRGITTRRKKRWRDMSPLQKAATVVLGLTQFTLAVIAWSDLARRPDSQVRGPKWRWAIAIGANFFGPVAYLRKGRVHPTTG
ncbi:MAG: PLDc N-terminal domain-containing protein [Acidimicrobiales bacterium]